MPGSSTFGKPLIAFAALALSHTWRGLRFLDVGAGHGNYSHIMRTLFPDYVLTGIEAWSPYVKQFDLQLKYDEIIVSDVRRLDWNRIPEFDIALFGDVLEHMTQNEAADVVERATQRGRCAFISLPIGYFPQEEEGDNPFERHIKENWAIAEIPITFRGTVGYHQDHYIGVAAVCNNPICSELVRQALALAQNQFITNDFSTVADFDYEALLAKLRLIKDGQIAPPNRFIESINLVTGGYEALIQELFWSILHRGADPTGLNDYCQLLTNGASLADVCKGLRSSDEFKQKFTLKTPQPQQKSSPQTAFLAKQKKNFAIVNKSYLKDLEWSLYLYSTAELHVNPQVEYFIIIPRRDSKIFSKRFSQAKTEGIIDQSPKFIIEEDLFSQLKIVIPNTFNGWMIQQVAKLAFGLTDLSENYLTIDSSTLFVRKFNWMETLFNERGNLKTAARPLRRSNRRNEAAQSKNLCWKDGVLVKSNEPFDFISEFIGELAEETYHYVSATGVFSATALRELLNFIQGKGLRNFAELIGRAPYECAWYGDFVYQTRPIEFAPTEPDIALICLEGSADIRKFEDGQLALKEGAICFQAPTDAPADQAISPSRAYNIVLRHYGISKTG